MWGKIVEGEFSREVVEEIADTLFREVFVLDNNFNPNTPLVRIPRCRASDLEKLAKKGIFVKRAQDE